MQWMKACVRAFTGIANISAATRSDITSYGRRTIYIDKIKVYASRPVNITQLAEKKAEVNITRNVVITTKEVEIYGPTVSNN